MVDRYKEKSLDRAAESLAYTALLYFQSEDAKKDQVLRVPKTLIEKLKLTIYDVAEEYYNKGVIESKRRT